MRIIIFIPLVLLPAFSWGACSPETIDFYLEKGFTQEQITKLCAGNGSDKPSYQPYQKPIVIYQEGYVPGVSAEERRAITELKGSIDGRSVDITDDSISYIRRVCLLAGQTSELDQRVKKCIDVAFSISRYGLKVTESGRGLILFGQQEVELESNEIIRKPVTADPWEAFSPDLRYQLKRKYESFETGNTTTLPLRKSASPGEVVSAIRTIAAATQSKSSDENRSEVSRVLDDSYVPPSEEDYAAAQPETEVVEEKKKKKRWWNPFD